MKPPLFALALLGAAAPLALAAPASLPANAPKFAVVPTPCAPDQNVDVVEAFLRMPTYVFRYFGISDPTSLIDGKGVVRDSKNGYIEVPYAGNSQHPQRAKLDKLQLKLFGDSTGAPVAVVNSTIFSETGVKPFIHVFRFKDDYPYRTTAKDWPFRRESSKVRDDDGPVSINYYLPRSGDIITSGLPESDAMSYSYKWNRRKFTRFMPKDHGMN